MHTPARALSQVGKNQEERYTFGDFTLDVAERRLVRGEVCCALAPKAFDVLVALVRDAGRLVTKQDLLDRVWPGSFVEEGILTVHISALRKVLGAGSGGRPYIETVTRSGYRFATAVTIARQGWMPTALGMHASPATNTGVYELIGRGRGHLLSASMSEVPDAVAAFRAAVVCDPTYAPAHAGLARACCALAQFRLAPFSEAYSEAKTAALCALAMDDACADAQLALGTVLFLSEWNWAGAERSLSRAIELNPAHTEAYLVYGSLMEALGQLPRGLDMKQKALERDPLSPLVHLQLSLSYWHQRRYDDAIMWANKSLALDPNHLLAREHLAGCYLKKRDFDRHMAENIAHAESHGVAAEALAPVREAYATGGRAAVVQYVLRQMSSSDHPAAALALAVHYAEAGDLDAAFRHLNRAIEARDPALVHLAVAPQWDDLRADPRFGQCLARMGLRPTN
jgi:DNA-binding winged helix-turn-helix (wHTH) protein/Tfp pilus assembly protein PilF